ncbi:MAG: PDZ domain-containing protein, partial [Rubripirellula sp.]
KTTAPVESTPMLPRNDSHNFTTMGVVMVPDVLETTPAYIDQVIQASAAHRAGMRPDDLILLVDGQRIESQRSFRRILRTIDRRDNLNLTVQRNSEILNLVLKP